MIFMHVFQNDDSMDNCQESLLMSDRVQVITSVKQSIENIWNQADCESKNF